MIFVLQITEVPENEVLTNRVVMLPIDHAATLGSGFDCTVQLPDRSNQISPVHGRFAPTPHGMILEATSRSSQILVNNCPIVFGRPKRMEDGTVITLGGYTILVTESGLENPQYADSTGADDPEVVEQDPVFSLNTDTMDDDELTSDLLHEHPFETQPSGDMSSYFSAQGVFAQDILGDDPFESEHLDQDAASNNSGDESFGSESPNESSATFEDAKQPLVETQSMNAFSDVVESNDVELIIPSRHQDHDPAMRQFEKLDQNDANKRVTNNQSWLFQAIDETLNVFLDEFSPDQLKEKYSGYRKPWFGRSKYNWEMYKAEYYRRRNRKEFHRLFKAILLDHMRGNHEQ